MHSSLLRFITNLLNDVWRLTVLAIVAVVITIVVVVIVIVFVFVIVATRSFWHIVSISANTNHGSSGKVTDTDIEIIDLPLFVLIYDLVNYEIQFQEVRECAFINDSKGGG
jgi:hypothetical protein